MGRHEGRRATPAPGPGAGDRPAAGIAAVPTAATATAAAGHTGAAPVYEPAPTAHAILALFNEVCGLWTEARAARAVAAYLPDDAKRAHVLARAGHWQALGEARYRALVETIHAACPEPAQLERFMPVRPLSNGHVELHAHDTAARRLVMLLTGAQALAVGAHLTAYGAISLDRIGQRPDPGLPHVRAAPPFTATANPAAEPAPVPADPPADQQ